MRCQQGSRRKIALLAYLGIGALGLQHTNDAKLKDGRLACARWSRDDAARVRVDGRFEDFALYCVEGWKAEESAVLVG